MTTGTANNNLGDLSGKTEIQFKDEILKYARHWKWFLLSVVLFLLCAFTYLSAASPEYRIYSQILIKDDKSGMGDSDALKQLNMFSPSKVVDNEIDILKSFTLMESVVKKLNLHVRYFYTDKLRETEVYGTGSPIKVTLVKGSKELFAEPLEVKLIDSKFIEVNTQKVAFGKITSINNGLLIFSKEKGEIPTQEMEVVVKPVDIIAESIIKDLVVESSSKVSSVLILELESNVPEKGIDILNNLIDAYNRAGLEDKNQVAANTLSFIEERLKFIAGDLSAVEKSVENYKSRERITDIGAESQLFLQSVKDNDAEINKVKIQQSVLNNIREYVRNPNEQAGMVPATLGISDPTLLEIISELSKLQAQRQTTLQVVRPENPMVKTLDDQIRTLKANLIDNVESLATTLSSTRSQLELENNKMERTIQTVPGKERQLVDITRQQSIKNNLYVYLLQKREETELSYAAEVSDSRIIDKPRSEVRPIRPIPKAIYFFFTLLGLVFPIAVIYVKEIMNDKIRSKEDITKETSVPIVGQIGHNADDDNLIVFNNSRSALSEQFRALRTNLSFYIDGKSEKIILLTSSMSGEGKSFVSINTANILAISGKKVLLMELDLRKPGLSTKIGLKNNIGFTNYIIDKNLTPSDIIRDTELDANISIITSGALPPNPAELLLNPRVPELMASLRELFDYIIIDAPPIGIVADAQLLSPHADMCVYIVRQNYTLKNQLSILNELQSDAKMKKLSVVVNDINYSKSYGYGYGYGYGSYDTESTHKKKLILPPFLKRKQ